MRQWIVCIAVFVFPLIANAQSSTESVRLDLVTYKQLGDEIKKLHGKVILVDFWADYCQPCKEKFPAVMNLQRKYAENGLQVVSVSVDDVTDADVRERVKAFLQQRNATSRNLLLAEKSESWVPKLKMDSIPSMFLFDQQGRLVNRWTGNDVDLQAIEKRIAQVLASPAK